MDDHQIVIAAMSAPALPEDSTTPFMRSYLAYATAVQMPPLHNPIPCRSGGGRPFCRCGDKLLSVWPAAPLPRRPVHPQVFPFGRPETSDSSARCPCCRAKYGKLIQATPKRA